MHSRVDRQAHACLTKQGAAACQARLGKEASCGQSLQLIAQAGFASPAHAKGGAALHCLQDLKARSAPPGMASTRLVPQQPCTMRGASRCLARPPPQGVLLPRPAVAAAAAHQWWAPRWQVVGWGTWRMCAREVGCTGMPAGRQGARPIP